MASKPVTAQGVRRLTLEDQLPDCEVIINQTIYSISDICAGKKVVDIGCGFGRNRKPVEDAGGEWIGVEPFEGGSHTVAGDAEDLPFPDACFDVAIMHAVLEHVPDASKAFSEVARVLKPGGVFIGYVAFMECFHEISYSHLSFKALEHFSNVNGMKLLKIGAGKRFGLDYHFHVLYYPLPLRWMRPIIAWRVRLIIRIKAFFSRFGLMIFRNMSWSESGRKAAKYYQLECLRLSTGFDFIIKKLL